MIEYKNNFIRNIDSLIHKTISAKDIKYDTKEFEESFLNQSSHSPDNIESIKHLEYGYVKKEYRDELKTFGLKVKDKDILLSDIVYFLESDNIVSLISKESPNLTIEEIEAAQRVITIIVLGLEANEMGK